MAGSLKLDPDKETRSEGVECDGGHAYPEDGVTQGHPAVGHGLRALVGVVGGGEPGLRHAPGLGSVSPSGGVPGGQPPEDRASQR